MTTKTSPAQDYAGKTDPEFCRAIGQRVRATREAAGMTQVQLCECIPGMTQSNLLKIESGKIEPRVASLQRIAAACGADYKALLP